MRREDRTNNIHSTMRWALQLRVRRNRPHGCSAITTPRVSSSWASEPRGRTIVDTRLDILHGSMGHDQLVGCGAYVLCCIICV
ncbi:hypothetical protein BDW67DRAFT_152614 [Aspergillus spinulosporus]